MRFLKSVVPKTILVAFLYLLLCTYLRNNNLIDTTFTYSASLFYKLKLFFILFTGLSVTMTKMEFITMLLVAILTGLNFAFIWEKIGTIKKSGKIRLTIGGSLIGIIGGGCASCGLPILSLLGIGGSALYLPFKGTELPYISIVLLLISLFLLRSNTKKAKMCKIETKKTPSFISTQKLASSMVSNSDTNKN